jgi:hypothetical protein
MKFSILAARNSQIEVHFDAYSEPALQVWSSCMLNTVAFAPFDYPVLTQCGARKVCAVATAGVYLQTSTVLQPSHNNTNNNDLILDK